MNLKLVILIAVFFLGIGSTCAQLSSTVIVTGKTDVIGSKYEIEIVKPDYDVEKKFSKGKEDNFFASMKREVDFWLEKGYKVIETSTNSVGTSSERMLIVLVKQD